MVARVLVPLAFVMALYGSAAADKPKLAVLGIEVAGSPDTNSTAHGRLLTEMFRGRVGVSPRYALAPNSIKDLLDEKVAGNCESEAAECMSKIGAKMKAQLLVYGKIEKRPKDGKDGYQVSMKSLDIDKRSMRDWGDWIPLSDFADGKLDARVARGFDILTRDDSAPAPNPANPNPNGVTGTHGLTKPSPKKSTGLGWKITAATATAVTVGLAAGGIVFRSKTKNLEGNCAPVFGMNGMPDPPLDSPSAYPNQPAGGPSANECADGPGFSQKAWLTGAGAVAVGGFALFAYYKGFIANKESPTQQTAGSRVRKKKPIAVTPIVSPDGAGATVRIDF